MKQFESTIATLILLSFSLLSCNKDTARPNKEASEYFPNKVGNYWEYDVYDSTTYYPEIRKYVVKVSIQGVKKMIDGIDAFTWKYEYPRGNDTTYVRIVGDTVKVYDKFRIETIRDLQFPMHIFLLPFQDGNRWDGKLAISKYSVTSEGLVNTSWNTFKDCFMINYLYAGPNMGYNDKYWFKPNIGFLKMYKHHYNFGPYNIELWELRKYYLQ